MESNARTKHSLHSSNDIKWRWPAQNTMITIGECDPFELHFCLRRLQMSFEFHGSFIYWGAHIRSSKLYDLTRPSSSSSESCQWSSIRKRPPLKRPCSESSSVSPHLSCVHSQWYFPQTPATVGVDMSDVTEPLHKTQPDDGRQDFAKVTCWLRVTARTVSVRNADRCNCWSLTL